ncbi:TPA: hypothetical protein ACNVDX_003489 [Citrobacter gillenii]
MACIPHAGTKAGTYNVLAKIADISIGSVAVTLQDTAVDLSQSTLDADKTSLVADGRDQAILTFSLNVHTPVARSEKEHIEFFIDHVLGINPDSITFGQIQEVKSGTYTTTLSGNIPLNQISVGVKYRGEDTGKRLMFDISTGLSVVISGNNGSALNAVVGEALQVTSNCTGICPSLSYQWQIEDSSGSGVFVDIVGANTSTYIPGARDQKRKIRVKVTE